MSKNKQILIFSGVGLLALGAVTAVLLATAPEAQPGEDVKEEEVTDERLILTEKTENDVVSVHVENAMGEYDIIRNDDGWTIDGLQKAAINENALKSLVKGVSAMTASQFVEENAEDLSKYGLSDPDYTVTVNYGGEEFSFSAGDVSPADSKDVYLCEKGKTTVYTYPSSGIEDFAEEKFAYIDTAAMPAYDQSSGEEVRKLTIERLDLEKPIVIEQIPAPEGDEIAVFSYELTSPYNAYADLTNSPNFIYSVFGLTADKAVWYGMEERDYEIAGLNNPSAVITVETNVKTYTVTLGNAVADEKTDENGVKSTEIVGFYGMTSEVADTLFLFNAESIPAMAIKPDDIISRLFLMPYIYSLDTVEYEDNEGNAFTLGFETVKAETEDGKDEHKHYLNGEIHDEQQIKNMYQYLIGASGDELYFEEEKGELLASVTYNYADPQESADVVRFYTSTTDRHVIINVNGQNLFKTKQIYINQLFSNVKSFLSGGEIVLTY